MKKRWDVILTGRPKPSSQEIVCFSKRANRKVVCGFGKKKRPAPPAQSLRLCLGSQLCRVQPNNSAAQFSSSGHSKLVVDGQLHALLNSFDSDLSVPWALNDRRWWLEVSSGNHWIYLRDKSRANRITARWRFSHQRLGQLVSRLGVTRGTYCARALSALHCKALGIACDYGVRRDLPLIHEPALLHHAGLDRWARAIWLAPAARCAWLAMSAAAQSHGVALEVVSAFRSIAYQAQLIRRKRARGQAIDDILRVSAAPGYSQHHSGCAIDIAEPGSEAMTEAFADTPAFAWLSQNAAQFGFRLSFPRDNRHGVLYEPWHWCYVWH
jgi:zinc D-Ala-D-Ala carboxypeptidase